MTNEQIADKIYLIIHAYLKGVKTKPEDQPIVQAGADLIINFIQNINTIANK